MAYAAGTTVPIERTKAEIEKMLVRAGATGLGFYVEGDRAQLVFAMKARRVMMILQLPDPKSPEFTRTPSTKWTLTREQASARWEQGCRSRWRALALIVRAKLEAVAANVTTFDEEFAVWFQMPDGRTVGSKLLPEIARVLSENALPPLLPAPATGASA